MDEKPKILTFEECEKLFSEFFNRCVADGINPEGIVISVVGEDQSAMCMHGAFSVAAMLALSEKIEHEAFTD